MPLALWAPDHQRFCRRNDRSFVIGRLLLPTIAAILALSIPFRWPCWFSLYALGVTISGCASA